MGKPRYHSSYLPFTQRLEPALGEGGERGGVDLVPALSLLFWAIPESFTTA